MKHDVAIANQLLLLQSYAFSHFDLGICQMGKDLIKFFSQSMQMSLSNLMSILTFLYLHLSKCVKFLNTRTKLDQSLYYQSYPSHANIPSDYEPEMYSTHDSIQPISVIKDYIHSLLLLCCGSFKSSKTQSHQHLCCPEKYGMCIDLTKFTQISRLCHSKNFPK